MINFKSESANKTQQNNARVLFGKTGLTVIKKLEDYSKEKSLDTSGIDALLEVLKTKDTELLEKFASSKTGKTLVTNCKQLAKAKTFTAIMKNIKAIKPLKSFDKFTNVSGNINSTGKGKAIIKAGAKSLTSIFNQLRPTEDGDVEDTVESFKDITGIKVDAAYRYTDEWFGTGEEAMSILLPRSESYAYYVPAGKAPKLARRLKVPVQNSFIFIDSNAKDGPFHDGLDLVPGSLKVAKTVAEEKELYNLFMGWVKKGVSKQPSYIVSDFKGYKLEGRNFTSRLTRAQELAIGNIADDLGDIYVESERRAGKIVWDAVAAAGLDPVYVAKNLTLSDPIKGRINLADSEIYIIFNCLKPKFRSALMQTFYKAL